MRARLNECIAKDDLAYPEDLKAQAATPQEAVRRLGFGRGTLSSERTTGNSVVLGERADGQLIGRYTVTRLSDGTWVLDTFLASVPQTGTP